MFSKMKHAWHWSKAMGLYLDQNTTEFLKEMEIYSSEYELTDFERVVVANAKILTGRNADAKTDFFKLALVIDDVKNPFLSLYCRASVADLDGDRVTYERLKKEAEVYRSARFDRALPM